MKFVRIFLLILIIIGVILLVTQKLWVPKLVNKILSSETTTVVVQTDAKSKTSDQKVVINDSNLKPNTFEWCIANGGKDVTPNYNAPKTCISNEKNEKVYRENCIYNDKYFVVEGGMTEDAGSDHLVKFKTSANQHFDCTYVAGNGDFEIKNEWAEYLLALENQFLILDSGTGPDPRGLIIYDLFQRKKAYTDTYSEPVMVQNNTIDYWAPSSEKATENNCPQMKENEANGLGSAIDKHVSLNLLTLAKKDLGESRCDARQ